MFKGILPAILVAIIVLLASKLVMSHLAPDSMTEGEATAWEYGGAALGAWVALTYAVKKVAAAG